MSYLVLARKWRPRTFASLVGQEHVVRALTHALDTQRLHHAWLFTGTRGVGKTTLSRLLAKSLNCEQGITATPCGQCQACTEIDAGRFVDYVELDAASNRGVDEMTQLLEQAVYAPGAGRFKVYMIDEVHMLTGHAFNAMLKTLEEPPPHVKFILATTDPQKIPVTVLSRCLQFNLKQIPPGVIVTHLQEILGQEGIAAEVPALQLLARAADGSMRDALSLTDQAIAYSAENLTLEAIQEMLGTIDQRYLVRLLQALAQSDAQAVLQIATELSTRGLSYQGALADLAVLLSRVAIAQRVGPDFDADNPLAAELAVLAQNLHPDLVQLFYSIAVHSRTELSLAPDEYAGFVMACLRMLALVPDDGSGLAGQPGGGSASPLPEGSGEAPTTAGSPGNKGSAGATPVVTAPAVGVKSAGNTDTTPPSSAAAPLAGSVATPDAEQKAPLVAPAASVEQRPVKPKAQPKAVQQAAPMAQAPASSTNIAPAWEGESNWDDTVSAASSTAVSTKALGAATQTDAVAASSPTDSTRPAEAPVGGANTPEANGSLPGSAPSAVAEPAATSVLTDAHQVDIKPAGLEDSQTGNAAQAKRQTVGSPGGQADKSVADIKANRADTKGPAPEVPMPAASSPETLRQGDKQASTVTASPETSRLEGSPIPEDTNQALPDDGLPDDEEAFSYGDGYTNEVPPFDDAPGYDEAAYSAAGVDDDAAEAASLAGLKLAAAGAEAGAPTEARPKKPLYTQLSKMASADWPALVVQLPLGGVAAELARQSEWAGVEGQRISLRVAVQTFTETEAGKERLCTVLSEHFGEVVSLNVLFGSTGDGTAHAIEQSRLRELQKQAEAAVNEDPLINELRTRFDARVIPDSIRSPSLGRAA